jgi:peptidase M23-like protein
MSAAPVIAALLLAVLASPAAAAWRPPVDGALTRPFAVTTNPFAAGQHRGIDLRAAPGTPVRAPCAGRVAVAGRVGTSGGVVTLRCGPWRVTHLPLKAITVHAGAAVARGERLGRVASPAAHPGTAAAASAGPPAARGEPRTGAGHAGLHLGVRREGDRFGYVDPLRFLAPAPSTPPAPLGRAPRGRHSGPHVRPRLPRAALATAPLAPLVATSLAAAAGSDPSRLAPWPAWLGLALVLAGAGVGSRWSRGNRTRTGRHVRAAARLSE